MIKNNLYMNEPSYGKDNLIEIDNKSYKLQSAEFEDETIFFLKEKDEILCAIMLDENNQWQPDIALTDEQFEQVMEWIRKLYLEGH